MGNGGGAPFSAGYNPLEYSYSEPSLSATSMMPSWRVRRNPKIDSEMLEHAYVSITLHTDSRSLPDMREKSAQAIEEALAQ